MLLNFVVTFIFGSKINLLMGLCLEVGLNPIRRAGYVPLKYCFQFSILPCGVESKYFLKFPELRLNGLDLLRPKNPLFSSLLIIPFNILAIFLAFLVFLEFTIILIPFPHFDLKGGGFVFHRGLDGAGVRCARS